MLRQKYLYNGLVSTYYRLVRKYRRYAENAQKRVQSSFIKKVASLRKRIEKLQNRLQTIRGAFKAGAATAALTAALTSGNIGQAQTTFELQTNDKFFNARYNSRVVMADFDNDGDVDVLQAQPASPWHYQENTGTAAKPAFADKVVNPFDLTPVQNHVMAVTTGDIDGDGDLDLMGGTFYSKNFWVMENTGTAASPAFASSQLDPFGLTAVPDAFVTHLPTLTDLDGDGDLDFLVGTVREIYYYENTGTVVAPAFGAPLTNPFGLSASTGFRRVVPITADFDDDGDLDLLAGIARTGDVLTLDYFENTGTATSPAFAAYQSDPFGLELFDGGVYITIAAADIDNDGDLDIYRDAPTSDFPLFFENTGTASSPAFKQQTPYAFGMARVEGAYHQTPTFGDIDGDGDLDMFFASKIDGDIFFLENTGTATAPAFAAPVTNPFGVYGAYMYNAPALVDIDADGDLDMFVKLFDQTIIFFENTGTATAPAFATAVGNVFGQYLGVPAYFTSLEFADIDGDGDYDFFASSQPDISVIFKENTGTANAPAFAADVLGPFGFLLGHYTPPIFTDIDFDGDLDIIQYAMGLAYFENSGNASVPQFGIGSYIIDPFGIEFPDEFDKIVMAMADIDGDGDEDLFASHQYGHSLFFYENTTPPALTATMTDSLLVDPNSNSIANPGETIRYRAVVSVGAGIDAQAGTFSVNLDPNTAMVPGSLKSTPLAINNSYSTAVDVALNIGTGSGLLSNDFDDDIPGLTVSSADNTSAQGFTVTVNADGSFTYTPAGGFSGSDTFSYTIQDAHGNNDTGVVTVNVQ